MHSDRTIADLTPTSDIGAIPPARPPSADDSPSSARTFKQFVNLEPLVTANADPPAITGYTCLRFLGHGGQGVVWLGLRNATQQKVALKVMHRDWMDDAKTRARFEHSYESLLALDHPGVVRPVDRGTLPSGELWYATEYISGKDLVQHVESLECEQLAGADGKQARQFPLRSVLELFVKLCEGVEAAHRAGVIHRDLKPSNIVVDTAGRPHIVDFGLAKTQMSRPAAMLTMTHEMIGTPFWASPEQVEGRPGGVDTRSDIYSLGVMLYQLVTERFPYDTDGPLIRLLDQIRYVEPPSPRSIVTWVGKDLQSVILKSIRKRPDERYQTVTEFRADIECVLRCEPVTARGGGMTYRAWTTVRRHRLAFGFAATVFSLTLVYGITATMMYRRAQSSAADAETKFRIAWEMANSVVSDIDSLLSTVPGTSEKRRALLALASSRLKELSAERIDDPRLLDSIASAHSKLGDVAGNLADEEVARFHLGQALAIRETLALREPGDPDRQAKLSFAIVRIGDEARGRGDLARCKEHYERALSIDEHLARSNPGNANFLDNLCWSYERNAWLLTQLGNPTAAAGLTEKRLILAERLAEIEPGNLIRQLNLMAALEERNSLEWAGGGDVDYQAQDARTERAFGIAKRLIKADPNRPIFLDKYANLCRNIASVQLRQGDSRAAIASIESGIEVGNRLLSIEPKRREWLHCLSDLHRQLGDMEWSQGDLVSAETALRKSLQFARQLTELYPENRDVLFDLARVTGFLASLTFNEKKPDESRMFYQEFMGMQERLAAEPSAAPQWLAGYAETLLTVPIADMKDLPKGLVFAQKAVDRSGGDSPEFLCTLALARWMNGDTRGTLAAAQLGLASSKAARPGIRTALNAYVDKCETKLRDEATASGKP